MKKAALYGISVGPGDPELLSLKAVRLIRSAAVVCYPVDARGRSLARTSAAAHLEQGQEELPLGIPMTAARPLVEQAYERGTALIASHLEAGRPVAVLCEGDAFFYGSFIQIWRRLRDRFPIEVVPGVSALHAAGAQACKPLAEGRGSLAVLTAGAQPEQILAALEQFDTVAIYKAGPALDRLRDLLLASGRGDQALYLEWLSHPRQRIHVGVEQFPAAPGSYFGMVLVSRPVTMRSSEEIPRQGLENPGGA